VPPSASSAKSRVRGRHWVMLWLVVFLAVAVAVQARQAASVMASGRVTRLREERAALEAQRAALQRQVRLATGRKELGRRAEDLGLHFPLESEIDLLRLRTPHR